MKNLIKNVIVAAMLLVSVSTASASEVPVKVKVAGAKSIELVLGEISGKVWISFKDEKGYVFYSKRVKDLTSYKVTYDVASLPDGEYRLELTTSDQTLNVPVTIVEGTVTLKEELPAAPVLSKKGNMVSVELSGTTENAWDVSIKNKEGDLIFIETVENVKVSRRKYDLSKLEKGTYVLEFSTAGNSFSHSVEKH